MNPNNFFKTKDVLVDLKLLIEKFNYLQSSIVNHEISLELFIILRDCHEFRKPFLDLGCTENSVDELFDKLTQVAEEANNKTIIAVK